MPFQCSSLFFVKDQHHLSRLLRYIDRVSLLKGEIDLALYNPVLHIIRQYRMWTYKNMNSASQGIEVESQQGTDGDNDFNNPDDSILNTEGYVEKVGSIVDYIENDYFYNSIQISRRTPKNKQLQNELFDYSVYTNNQCGFTTSRPLFWVNAINTYINSSEYIYGKFFTKHPKTLSEKC